MSSPALQIPSAGRTLSGFLLSGFLFALPGAILPAWYHLGEHSSLAFGTYFLSLAVGVIAAGSAAMRLLNRGGLVFLLVFSCALACAALLYLALVPPPSAAAWRAVGLFGIGASAALLNTALFHAISRVYQSDPASTVNLGGIFFGVGSVAAALLVGGTFYAYTVAGILTLVAVVPGWFAGIYAHASYPTAPPGSQPTVRQAMRDFKSLGAILFALLLFFQFGNEWAIAGWLPIFLTRRLGISPATSVFLLALYWLALMSGRAAAVIVLPRVHHGRLLLASSLAAAFGCTMLLATTNTGGASVGVLLVGGGFASIYPLVAEKIGRRFAYYHPGFFNGIFSFALMGGMLAPASLGYLAAAMDDIRVVMWLPMIGIWMVVALLLLIWLESKVTGR